VHLRAGSGLAFLVTVGAALLLAVAPAHAAMQMPSGFEQRVLADNFGAPGHGDPVDVAWAPDGRMFIADRNGVVFAHNPGDPPGTNTPVLDISSHVNNADLSDRGLLSVAPDKDFASNGWLYLLYTYDEDDSDSGNRKVSTLTRVTVKPDNSVVGGLNSPTETTILGKVPATIGTGSDGACGAPANTNDCIPSEGLSHSIGTVRVAPDGSLYVGTGDGSDYLIVDPIAQNDNNPLTYRGKIMHIDRNGNGLPGHPFCPSDTDLTHVCTKIYAAGLRNPFRFTLRPGGGLAIGDVGQNDWEEVNLSNGGEQFGWPCYEGAGPDPFHDQMGAKYSDLQWCKDMYAANNVTAPAFTYPHGPAGCDANLPSGNTVVGGPVYMGDQYPAGFRGQLFFGDVGDFGGPPSPQGCGWIGRAGISGKSLVNYQKFATGWPLGVDLEIAPDGNLAFVSLVDDEVVEIVYGPGNHKPSAAPTAKEGAKSLSVDFHAGASDPDGDVLYYDWDFGDGSPHGIGPAPIHVYSSPGTRTVTLTVDDGRGMSATATVPATAEVVPKKKRLQITRLRLSRRAAALARKGELSGSFSSSSLVSRVNVSVWRGRANSKSCKWWSRRTHALKRGACDEPHWMRTRLHRKGHRYTWTLRLSGNLPRGSYTVVVHAVPHNRSLTPSARLGTHLRLR
jgi:glucose/arabinose dehydrogenase